MIFFPELSHLIYEPMELEDMLSCIHKFKSPQEIKSIIQSYKQNIEYDASKKF